MPNENEVALRVEYRATMEKLEEIKRVSSKGNDYWMAREIGPLLGYPEYSKFEPVIERAMEACVGTGLPPSNHFAQTSKMVELGSGGRREVDDFFLSRPACYLIAMNGQPSKPEVAAAQAYFAVQTRRMELADQQAHDEKRLQLRQKVTQSFRKISGVAQDVGVKHQAFFHDARYQGLYGMSLRAVKKKKGLDYKENLLDRAGALELSANDFQMNLAAEVIVKKDIRGEVAAIAVNKEIGEDVRKMMKDKGGTLPEDLPLEPPIAEVKKRLAKGAKNAIEPSKPTGSST